MTARRLVPLLLAVIAAAPAAANPRPAWWPDAPAPAGPPARAPDLFAAAGPPAPPPTDGLSWPDMTGMMRAGLDLSAPTGGLWPFFGESEAADAPPPADPVYDFPQPYERMRRILRMQERAGLGDDRAFRRVGPALDQAAVRFAGMPPEIWTDIRNTDALALYLMAGGEPAPVRSLLKDGTVRDGRDGLVAALLLKVDGKPADAFAALKDRDVYALPPLLGAHLALAQADLAAEQADPRAPEFYDRALAILPGSFVEESALRRAAVEAGRRRDYVRFRALCRTYIARWSRSVFFGDLQQQVALALLAVDSRATAAAVGDIRALTEGFDPLFRRDLYLLLARRALLAGTPDLARLAAEVGRDMADDPPSRARAALYLATADMLSGRAVGAAAGLGAVVASDLPERDAPLLRAAEDLGRQLADGRPAGADDDDALVAEARARLATADPFASAVPARAATLVAAASIVLKEAARVP